MDLTAQIVRSTRAWLELFIIVSVVSVSTNPAAGPVRALDLNGQPVDPLRVAHDVKAIVLVFTTIDCPISNRYAPVVRRLHEKFGGKGVRFWLVFPNPTDTPDAVRSHLKRFAYHVDALRDPRQELVRLAQVTVAPEAAILDRAGRTMYRGRIDDRYVDLGVERPAPTRRDLEEALLAILEERPVAQRTSHAVGCLLSDFLR